MVQLNSTNNKTLNIILQNTNKVLKRVVQDASPQDLAMLKKSKDLGSVLESLFKNSTDSKLQNQELLQLLKNNPTLKSLGSITTTLKEFNALMQKTQTEDKNLLKLQSLLSDTLTDIKQIDDKTLKHKFQNSGIFLESKLKETIISKELISNDLKAALNKSIETLQSTTTQNSSEVAKHLDKLALQIDYYQLLSHLSEKSVLYIPYSFDALEDGNISLNTAKNKKFFCDINLNLKEYGKLDLRLGLFEKNQLNINIICQSQKLQDLLQQNIPLLKEQLFAVGLYPQNIQFLDPQNEDTALQNYQHSLEDLELGFEVKA